MAASLPCLRSEQKGTKSDKIERGEGEERGGVIHVGLTAQALDGHACISLMPKVTLSMLHLL